MKITVVLHNIRSVYNVGAILRTCEGMGVARVVYSGYTPRYEDIRLLPHLRQKLNRQIEKAALGAEKLVPQENVEDLAGNVGDSGKNTEVEAENNYALLTFLEKCAIMAYRRVGLENNLTGFELSKQIILGKNKASTGEEIDFGSQIVLVLGEEVHGIPPEIRAKMDYFLEIPMKGQKESFNVSVATGIALWGLSNLYD